MKLSLRTALPFALCILAVSVGHAETRKHTATRFEPSLGRELVSSHAVLDAGDVDNVPPTLTLDETIVTGTVPTSSAPSGRVSVARSASNGHVRLWACGPVEANRIGGSQRSCEYR